ncbi:MAG: hypothetical protein LBS46_03145 [Dysgonamonadaceae bacterium]|jgi:hypothetical protein|nr:hypothetical protein [Dysgonamonadaceae bacterium]
MNDLFTNREPWIGLAGLFLFLLIYAVLTVTIVNKKKKTASAGRLASIYMALKTARILLYSGAVLVYVSVVKIEVKRFVLAAVIMYLVYLLLDTLFLTATEKRLKKR